MNITDPSIDVQIDSNVRKFLDLVNSGTGKPIEELPPIAGRQVLTDVQQSVSADLAGVDVSEKTIVSEGLNIRLFIVRPAGVTEQIPAFMFFHGGGWVIGDYPTHERLVRDLVFYSGLAAVFVDYSRSPEAKFPIAINEAYAATKWVAENGHSINVNGGRLAVAGNSVGGNMAAAVALMAKEKKGPELKFQLLMWPVTDADFETGTYNQYATGRFLTKTVMKYYWDSYLPDAGARKNHLASILQSTVEQLQGLPPAMIQTAENDVLRDEGEAYGRKLDMAGVPVAIVRFNGMIHDFGLLNPLAQLPGVLSHIGQGAAALKLHLQD